MLKFINFIRIYNLSRIVCKYYSIINNINKILILNMYYFANITIVGSKSIKKKC